MKTPTIFIYPKGEKHTMNENEINELIKNALYRDVDKTREEYAKARENASRSADFHTTGDPEATEPVTEELKHSRVQSNFYATALNFLFALTEHALAIRMHLEAQTALLTAIAEKNGIKVDTVDPNEGGEASE
jgi:hypothetical protein